MLASPDAPAGSVPCLCRCLCNGRVLKRERIQRINRCQRCRQRPTDRCQRRMRDAAPAYVVTLAEAKRVRLFLARKTAERNAKRWMSTRERKTGTAGTVPMR